MKIKDVKNLVVEKLYVEIGPDLAIEPEDIEDIPEHTRTVVLHDRDLPIPLYLKFVFQKIVLSAFVRYTPEDIILDLWYVYLHKAGSNRIVVSYKYSGGFWTTQNSGK